MKTKWFKIMGAAIVAGAISVVAFGAVAFAQNPTPTPNENNNGWFGKGHGMRGGFGMTDGFGLGMRGGPMFGNHAQPENSFFAIAAKALGMTEAELLAQWQQGKSIAELAKEKNVDTAKIVSEALKLHEDAFKTAVTQKQITQAQADAMLALHKTNLEAKLTYKYDATNAPQRGFGMFGRGLEFGQAMGHGLRGENSFFNAAAAAFNITAADLLAQLQQGKTLAEIAQEKNVDTAKLVSDYTQTLAATLKTAVSQKQITQAQADAMLAQHQANAEALLTKKFDATNFGTPGFGMFGPGGRGGHGHGGGWR